jgi:hypothetical protein
VEKHDVQVVFDGHLHAYARSRPHNGVLYVAVRTGRAELEYDAGDLDDPLLARRLGPFRRPAGGRRGSRGALPVPDGRGVRDEFRVSCS